MYLAHKIFCLEGDWEATPDDKRLFFQSLVEKIQQHLDNNSYLNYQGHYTRDIAYNKILDQGGLAD